MGSSRPSHFMTIGVVVIGLMTPQPARSFSAKKRIPEAPSLPLLSEVARENRIGLTFSSEEELERTKSQAALFARIRKQQAKADEKAAFAAQCADHSSIFCREEWLLDPQSSSPTKVLKTRIDRAASRKIRKHLFNGEIQKIAPFREPELRKAFSEIPGFSRLKKATASLLSSPDCDVGAVALFLGAKAEESFPDPELQLKAMELYDRAAACGGDAGDRARFRLGLMQVWQDRCSEAFGNFETLEKTREFRSRALFWKNHCGEKLGKTELASAALESLRSEHPFSLHTLVAGKAPGLATLPPDSPIRFRSSRDGRANEALSAAEALILTGESRVARELLVAHAAELDQTEPEVQLYLALLFNRIDDYIQKFRILSTLFRDYPSTLSRASLQLYFPRKELRTESIQRVGLDELLVLSLIRQESAFAERARSPAGALGLMQVMPSTARLLTRGKRPDLLDPEQNLRIGSKYFAQLIARFGGDTELALAAYNAGPKRVDEWVRRYPLAEDRRLLFIDLIPFRETRDYVASIARNYYWYSLLYESKERPSAHFPLFDLAFSGGKAGPED